MYKMGISVGKFMESDIFVANTVKKIILKQSLVRMVLNVRFKGKTM